MMFKVVQFLKKEFLEMLPPTIFFLVAFHVVAFARLLMAEEYDISFTSSAKATIGAIVVGKAILITNGLPMFNWFLDKKLIYNMGWRILLYVIIALLLQFIEELIPHISKQGNLSTAFEQVFEEIKWTRFWAVHLIFVLFLVAYTFITALIDVIGRDETIDVFFGEREK